MGGEMELVHSLLTIGGEDPQWAVVECAKVFEETLFGQGNHKGNAHRCLPEVAGTGTRRRERAHVEVTCSAGLFYVRWRLGQLLARRVRHPVRH